MFNSAFLKPSESNWFIKKFKNDIVYLTGAWAHNLVTLSMAKHFRGVVTCFGGNLFDVQLLEQKKFTLQYSKNIFAGNWEIPHLKEIYLIRLAYLGIIWLTYDLLKFAYSGQYIFEKMIQEKCWANICFKNKNRSAEETKAVLFSSAT